MELQGAGPVAVWRRMLLLHADLVDEIGTRLTAEHGLTVTEFDVLINIPPGATIRHRDLLREIVLSRSALSRLLRRLESRGLVTQVADPVDHRGVCVALTDVGAHLRRRCARTNSRVVRSAFNGLTEEDLAILDVLVNQLRMNLEHGRTKT